MNATPPPLAGLHHVTFGVPNIEEACDWFQRLFGAERQTELDHLDDKGRVNAVILRVPGIEVPVQLQESADDAWQRVQAISLSAPDGAALRAWVARLGELGVEHGQIGRRMSGEAFDLVTPVGTRIRVYAAETTRPATEAETAQTNASNGITLRSAATIVDAALTRAGEDGHAPMTVAVLDRGGQLVAFAREDGSSLLREQVARAKALGALNMGVGSRALAQRAEQHPAFIQSLTVLSAGNIVPVPGGVLVHHTTGALLGAVGVSGGLPALDEACAVHGIETAGLVPDVG